MRDAAASKASLASPIIVIWPQPVTQIGGTLTLAASLTGIPAPLRAELLAEYETITRNYRRRLWQVSELDADRFCEIVYAILQGRVSGDYPSRSSRPPDFMGACGGLARAQESAQPHSVRIGIPRVLLGLYELRKHRGAVAGEISAHQMDATYLLHAVRWVMAELVRLFHETDPVTAAAVVSALAQRSVPAAWTVGDAHRIMRSGLLVTDQTLLLLYGEPAGMPDHVLAKNLAQTRLTEYRRILTRLHDQHNVEYDSAGVVTLSPRGIKEVEDNLLTGLADA